MPEVSARRFGLVRPESLLRSRPHRCDQAVGPLDNAISLPRSASVATIAISWRRFHHDRLPRSSFLPPFRGRCRCRHRNGAVHRPSSARRRSEAKQPLFKISLAEWSLHRTLFDRKIDNLDFPLIAKRTTASTASSTSTQFFKDKAKDNAYLTDLKKRATTTA